VVQTSEQIMEKAKGLEMSQQESIDQLQTVQDQLRNIQQMVAAQRAESKKLSEQVGEISSNLDGLRHSFASTQAADSAERSATTPKPVARTARAKAKKPVRKRTKSRR
jgi:phage-related tail protein